MKNALLFLLTLAFTTAALASESKSIEDTFHRYWSSYSKKDFVRAAADVLPTDLEAAKAAILPVFLAAQTHKEKEVQEMVTAFFGRTVGKARETLTPVDVFVGLNRLALTANPDLFEFLKDASTTVVFVRRPAADEAEIHFQVSLRGNSDMDSEALAKKNGRWWVRLGDDPKETAEQFKAMFSGQS
jgi:hypothetical protein